MWTYTRIKKVKGWENKRAVTITFWFTILIQAEVIRRRLRRNNQISYRDSACLIFYEFRRSGKLIDNLDELKWSNLFNIISRMLNYFKEKEKQKETIFIINLVRHDVLTLTTSSSQPVYVPFLVIGLPSEGEGLRRNSHAGPCRLEFWNITGSKCQHFLLSIGFKFDALYIHYIIWK